MEKLGRKYIINDMASPTIQVIIAVIWGVLILAPFFARTLAKKIGAALGIVATPFLIQWVIDNEETFQLTMAGAVGSALLLVLVHFTNKELDDWRERRKQQKQPN